VRILSGHGLAWVGSLSQVLKLKLFDWDDDPLVRDNIDHGEDARTQSGVREVKDGALQVIGRGE
jgi:hypothetical protein